MNVYWLTAAVLCFVLGLVHSLMGEKMNFRPLHKQREEEVPTKKSELKRFWGIIWASWHLLTLFGWCFGFILYTLAEPQTTVDPDTLKWIIISITSVMVVGAAFVFFATKARHPGWIILLAISILLILGLN